MNSSPTPTSIVSPFSSLIWNVILNLRGPRGRILKAFKILSRQLTKIFNRMIVSFSNRSRNLKEIRKAFKIFIFLFFCFLLNFPWLFFFLFLLCIHRKAQAWAIFKIHFQFSFPHFLFFSFDFDRFFFLPYFIDFYSIYFFFSLTLNSTFL